MTLNTNTSFSVLQKIYGIGFDASNASCFKKNILDQLGKTLPNMIITNEIPDQADIIILNLDCLNTIPLLKKKLPPDNCFIIVIAHEITRATILFLKLADHIIFINDIQKYVCEDFLNLEYSSSILPYPFGEGYNSAEDNYDCFIYFEGDDFLLDLSYYEEKIQMGVKWHPYPIIKKYHVLFEVNSMQQQKFEEFKLYIEKKHPNYTLYNIKGISISDIINIAGMCFCGQVFKNESILEQYIESIENRKSWILHDKLSESPILSILNHLNISTAPSFEKSFYNYNIEKKSTWMEWQTKFENLIAENTDLILSKKLPSNNTPIDVLSDLNIISGSPLRNEFIFSVCFRNQQEKIIRCLNSLIDQAGGHDIGLAIISDASTDDSLQMVLDFLSKKKVNTCIVSNTERKYASRNFYNVAHLLTTNDESIIIEVDGDDFLSGDHVLNTLSKYYANGALKTNGSFALYPHNSTYFTENELAFNHAYETSEPWSVRCSSWMHLRSVKRHILCKVELKYFLERHSKQWLVECHDTATQPRMIELAEGKAIFVKEVLYNYDLTGEAHDHAEHSTEERIIESYKKTDKLYHPIYD